MNKLHRIMYLVLFILISCKTSTEPLFVDNNFFPLNIGNKWYYNTNGSDADPILIIMEVVAIEEINDKSYYLVTNSNIQYSYKDSIYYRINNSVLYSKMPNNEEQIVADFSLKKNEYAYWDVIGDLKVTEKTNSIMKFERPFSADYGSSVTYQKKIGIIESILNGFIFFKRTLVRAEIVN